MLKWLPEITHRLQRKSPSSVSPREFAKRRLSTLLGVLRRHRLTSRNCSDGGVIKFRRDRLRCLKFWSGTAFYRALEEGLDTPIPPKMWVDVGVGRFLWLEPRLKLTQHATALITNLSWSVTTFVPAQKSLSRSMTTCVMARDNYWSPWQLWSRPEIAPSEVYLRDWRLFDKYYIKFVISWHCSSILCLI